MVFAKYVFNNTLTPEKVVEIGKIMDKYPFYSGKSIPGIKEMAIRKGEMRSYKLKIVIDKIGYTFDLPFNLKTLMGIKRGIIKLIGNTLTLSLYTKNLPKVKSGEEPYQVYCTLSLTDEQRKTLFRHHARYLDLYDRTIKAYMKGVKEQEVKGYAFSDVKPYLPPTDTKAERRWYQLAARNIAADLELHYKMKAPHPYTTMKTRETPVPLNRSIVKTRYNGLKISGTSGFTMLSRDSEDFPTRYDSVVMKYSGSTYHLIFTCS